MALKLSIPVRQVSVSRFGGLYTEADQRDLPIGASPLNSDCDFVIGSTTIRPGLVSVETFATGGTILPTATLQYIRAASFIWPVSRGPLIIFQASDGTFWVDYENSGNATQIYSGFINKPWMLSETFGNFEYCALGNWGSIEDRTPLQGVDQPRTFTFAGAPQFDRVSQIAPVADRLPSDTLVTNLSQAFHALGSTTAGPPGSPYGPLAGGTRYAVLMYQMRNGYITPASMPISFQTVGPPGPPTPDTGINFTNLPLGPPEAEFVIVAVTIPVPVVAGVANPPGAGIGGPYFYIPFGAPGSTVVVNGTASFPGVWSDVLLTSGINITVPGNNLLPGNQREIGECVKIINYGGRAFYLGERTKVDNLVNMTFDAGNAYNGVGIPGWTQIGTALSYSLVQSPIYGLTLQITNPGSLVNGGFGPPPPGTSQLTATAGSGQSTQINTNFPIQLQATLVDANNSPISGASVLFTAPVFGASGTWGGFTSVVTAVTNSSGVATAPVFTANTTTGSYIVTASTAGMTVNFSLQNTIGTVPSTPSSITATAGSGQTATVSTAFTTQLQATVKDQFGNPMNGITVTFTAPASGASGTFVGSVTTVTAATNASGIATAPVFTANAMQGTYAVTASVSGLAASASFTLSNVTTGVTGCPGAPTAPATVTTLGPSGGDDTTALQNALNSTASAGQALQLTAGTFHIGPINIPTNAYLILASGVTVTDSSAVGPGVALLNVMGNNVTIVGAGATSSIFQMPNSFAASVSDGNQDRHCLRYVGASATSYINNMYVSGCSFNQSGGDGSYTYFSSNVNIVNCTFDGNFRQGSTVIGHVDHIHFCGCTFSHTSANVSGAGNGVDVEPNDNADYLNDVTFTDCYFTGNARDGIDFSYYNLDGTSPAISITVLRGHTSLNQRYGYFSNNNGSTNPGGSIMVQNSTSDQDGFAAAQARFYAANGASLTFQNLTVTNCHVNGPDVYGDNSAVTIIRGGGATVVQGNVHYLGTNISSTNGKLQYYFQFQDDSNIGNTNETFDATGTLSGATLAPPNGLYQGHAQNTVP